MRLEFYGTGASEGFPAVFCECENCERARGLGGKNLRSRASLGIDGRILIDFGPDSYAHMLYGKLRPAELEHILITHSHRDHFYPPDLGCIAPPFALYERERRLKVCGNSVVTERLANETGDTKGHLLLETLKAGESFAAGDYKILPLGADHNPAEDCLIYCLQKENKTLLYGLDSAFYPEESWEILKNIKLDCVVMDCTCGAGAAVFEGHMGLEENRAVRARMLKEGIANGQTIFIATHFAHGFAPFHEEFTELFAKEGITPAYDGMVIEF